MKKKSIGLLLVTLSTTVFSVTLQINPSKDNTLYESGDGAISNGAGNYTFIGKTTGNSLRRAVMKFDLSAIPIDSVVSSANLSITVSRVPASGQASTANLHLLLTDWGEGVSQATGNQGGGTMAEANDTTWLHTFYSSQFWTAAGGDFNPASSTTANYGTTNGEIIAFPSSNSLIADIQLWIDTPINNFGWIIVGDESSSGNTRRFNTRESTTGKPVLTIEYTTDNIFTNEFEQ